MQDAAQGVQDLHGKGLSILEISHRSPEFKAILEEAILLGKELLQVPEDYELLYLTGGASTQFFMTAMNLLGSGQTASYLDTGSWSTKAIKEAKKFGQANVVASSSEQNFNYIPKDYEVPDDSVYLHLTSNNTIYGTQLKDWPQTDVPYVCDMSSDIYSRPIDVNRFDVIYGGAQKNLGPAGTTLVIVRKDALGKVDRDIPTMLDYRTHIKKDSAFNTPPVFPIYCVLLTLRWIKANGGVPAMEKANAEKAKLMYGEIDRNPMFEGTVVDTVDRSVMNATFKLKNEDLNSAFLEACKQANISGIKGHRSVGGFRASMYNALPKSSVEHLIDVMQDFEKKHD